MSIRRGNRGCSEVAGAAAAEKYLARWPEKPAGLVGPLAGSCSCVVWERRRSR